MTICYNSHQNMPRQHKQWMYSCVYLSVYSSIDWIHHHCSQHYQDELAQKQRQNLHCCMPQFLNYILISFCQCLAHVINLTCGYPWCQSQVAYRSLVHQVFQNHHHTLFPILLQHISALSPVSGSDHQPIPDLPRWCSILDHIKIIL